MAQLFCPLCKQPVSQKIWDEISGLEKIRKQAEEKQKSEIKALKKERSALKTAYAIKAKTLDAQYKAKSLKEVQKKTSILNKQIQSLNQQIQINNARATQRISDAIHTAEKKEQKKYEKILAQAKKQLYTSAQKDVKSKLETYYQKRELKSNAKSQKEINKMQTQKLETIKRMASLTKTNMEQQKRITDLQNQVKKQTTPQVEGLLYEDKLLVALQSEFPLDEFKHTGKGGDILQFIKYKEKIIGSIIYECKRVLKFSSAHVVQTLNAQRQRGANFGILVTNASQKGFQGFSIEKGVIIVHPAGVLSLAKLLRDRIIEMENYKLGKEQKNKMVQDIIAYMESPEFANSINAIIQITIDENDDLNKEVKDHYNRWKKRKRAYFNLYSEAISMKGKTLDALTGEKAKTELLTKEAILRLPEPKED